MSLSGGLCLAGLCLGCLCPGDLCLGGPCLGGLCVGDLCLGCLSPGISVRGNLCLGGSVSKGGSLSQRLPSPVNRKTDRGKNMNFLQTSFAIGNKLH